MGQFLQNRFVATTISTDCHSWFKWCCLGDQPFRWHHFCGVVFKIFFLLIIIFKFYTAFNTMSANKCYIILYQIIWYLFEKIWIIIIKFKSTFFTPLIKIFLKFLFSIMFDIIHLYFLCCFKTTHYLNFFPFFFTIFTDFLGNSSIRLEKLSRIGKNDVFKVSPTWNVYISNL